MGVQFFQGPFDHQARHLFAAKLGECWAVCFTSDRSMIWRCPVHWLERHKRTTPCLGAGECPHCRHRAPDLKAYAPGLIWHKRIEQSSQGAYPFPSNGLPYNSLLWKPRVLEITRSNLWLLDQARPGLLAMNSRMGKANNVPAKFFVCAETMAVPEHLAFDCRAHLLRTWGITRVVADNPQFAEQVTVLR
jgi:hypothetical protein